MNACSGGAERSATRPSQEIPIVRTEPAPSEPAQPSELQSPPASPPISPVVPEAPRAPSGDHIVAARVETAPVIDGALGEEAWSTASSIAIDHDGRGEPFAGLETRARLLWTPEALFLAFEGTFDGAVDAPVAPITAEYDHLYGHDALEAFLDADPSTPETYRELELGPTGHFLDVAVDRARRPRGDVLWSSGMTLATLIDAASQRFTIEARVPASAFGDQQLTASSFRIGLYRIARVGGDRHFLARFPTNTERPNFHVPERFGWLDLAP